MQKAQLAITHAGVQLLGKASALAVRLQTALFAHIKPRQLRRAAPVVLALSTGRAPALYPLVHTLGIGHLPLSD